ncbi:unnamed protein product [Durusdinium trenchii]|uniref:Uncharacterized protein n=1 Tax=Durusdinium trenchii TaxID=1381693 RepID=A0ABP0QV22_9DINO
MKGIFLKQEEQGRWPPSVDDLAFGPPEVVIRFDTGRDLGRRGEQSDPRRRGLTSAAARRMRQGEQSLREMKVKEMVLAWIVAAPSAQSVTTSPVGSPRPSG